MKKNYAKFIVYKNRFTGGKRLEFITYNKKKELDKFFGDLVVDYSFTDYQYEGTYSVIPEWAIKLLKEEGNCLLLTKNKTLYVNTLFGKNKDELFRIIKRDENFIPKAIDEKALVFDMKLVENELIDLGFTNINFKKTKEGDYICEANFKCR